MSIVTLEVENMHCDHCVHTIQSKFRNGRCQKSSCLAGEEKRHGRVRTARHARIHQGPAGRDPLQGHRLTNDPAPDHPAHHRHDLRQLCCHRRAQPEKSRRGEAASVNLSSERATVELTRPGPGGADGRVERAGYGVATGEADL